MTTAIATFLLRFRAGFPSFLPSKKACGTHTLRHLGFANSIRSFLVFGMKNMYKRHNVLPGGRRWRTLHARSTCCN